jgi:hypothetical protein
VIIAYSPHKIQHWLLEFNDAIPQVMDRGGDGDQAIFPYNTYRGTGDTDIISLWHETNDLQTGLNYLTPGSSDVPVYVEPNSTRIANWIRVMESDSDALDPDPDVYQGAVMAWHQAQAVGYYTEIVGGNIEVTWYLLCNGTWVRHEGNFETSFNREDLTEILDPSDTDYIEGLVNGVCN